MAKILQKVFTSADQVSQSFTVQSWHVSQSVDAFTGASDYDITISGSLTVIGPTIGSFTGSLLGTSSWADNAITASYILNAVSSSFASTASFVQNAQTASYVLNAVSSSFASTASFVNPLNQSVILTGSLNTTGSVIFSGLTTSSQPFLVTINNSTGQIFYTSAVGLLASASQPTGPLNSYQFNNGGTFSGSSALIFSGGVVRGSGSFTGSFTGIYNNLISLSQTGPNSNFQVLYGNGTTISGSAGMIFNPSTAKLFTQRFEVNGANNAADGFGQVYLNGNTGNRIDFNINGVAAPTTGTRSAGTKIVLFPAVSPSSPNVDYAIGIEGSTLWNSVATTSNFFRWYAGTTNIATLAGNGTFSAINDIIAFSTSDKRLKDNITLISNPIEKIQKIGGYEFDWIPTEYIHSYEGHDIGVIAQEIEEVLPELVTTRDNGYKAVKYDKIVALLIEAIKDQQKQIEELKSKIG
jgi:hypothetical protein